MQWVQHGGALAVHRLLSGAGMRLGAVAGLILTQAFVLLTWVPFRAESFGDTLTVWHAFTGLREGGAGVFPWTVWLVPLLIVIDAVLGRTDWRRLGRSDILRRPVVYWTALGALTAVLLSLYPLEAAPFVYFQF